MKQRIASPHVETAASAILRAQPGGTGTATSVSPHSHPVCYNV
jgi:hypothetical protein